MYALTFAARMILLIVNKSHHDVVYNVDLSYKICPQIKPRIFDVLFVTLEASNLEQLQLQGLESIRSPLPSFSSLTGLRS